MLYRINQKNKVDTLSVERIKTRKVKTENEKQNKSKRQAGYEKCEKKERKHQMEIMDRRLINLLKFFCSRTDM